MATLSDNLIKFAELSCLQPPLLWIQKSLPFSHLNSIFTEIDAKYYHTSTLLYYEQKYQKLIGDSSKDVSSDSTGCSARMKRKSSQLPTIQCIFCDEKEKDFSKKSKKQKLHVAGEFHTSFQKPNVQHVNSLTKKWRDMACFLGDTNILSKLDSDVRANVKRNMYPVTIQLRIKVRPLKVICAMK